jgi:hypothetical protein
MLQSKQNEIEQLIQNFIKKNFEYQNVLNSVLTLNRKLMQKRIEDSKKQQKKKLLKYYKNEQTKMKKDKNHKVKSTIRLKNNSSLRNISKPGFMQIIKNSFSFIDVSDYSNDSTMNEKTYKVPLNPSNSICTSLISLKRKNKKHSFSDSKLNKPNEMNFITDQILLKSKASSVKSKFSINESIKLKDLTLTSKKQSIASSEVNMESITQTEQINSIFKKKINEKCSGTSSNYSEDILQKAKKIQSHGTSDYLGDGISEISSFGNVKKINFNFDETESSKSEFCFLF